MHEKDEIREFLTTRRAKLTPAQAGLPDFGGRRRVTGLRREEVALLAGISTQYYIRFERGNADGISEVALQGVIRALQLDDVETNYLRDLVGASKTKRYSSAVPLARTPSVPPGVQETLDALTGAPAVVQNGHLDILATNRLGRALFSPLFSSEQPANFAHYLFLNDEADSFYRNWEAAAQITVAMLRAEAGRAPYDEALKELIDTLLARSDRFRTYWLAHDVKEHRTGVKRLRHPAVGDLDMNYTSYGIATDPGLDLLTYTAPSGSLSAQRLRLLTDLKTH